MTTPGQIFVVSGPSGSGKSTILRHLLQRVKGVGYSVSHTSRTPRGTEKEGVDYHFVDRAGFRSMIEQGAFVEWAEVYGDFYGTSFKSLYGQKEKGRDLLLDLDLQGAINIKNQFSESVLIFLVPPTVAVLEQRLRDRGTDDEAIILKRMNKAHDEIRNFMEYDYVVINEALDRTIATVESIIISERCRAKRQALIIKAAFRV
jgi:guanylate kinase